MSGNDVIQIHNNVLNYLLNYKKEHKDFTFSTRVKNTKERLEKGYWFLGSHYVFVPLYKIFDVNNHTQTIGFVVNGDAQYIEIVFNEIKGLKENEQLFYNKLIEYLGSLAFLDEDKQSGNKYYFRFQQKKLEENLNFYINEFRYKTLELLERYALKERYLVTKEEFEKKISRIIEFKKNLDNNKNIKVNQANEEYSMKVKNIIIYGSPGVGKTHNTTNLIGLIESGESEKEIFEIIKSNEYNSGVDVDDVKDRVKFVTFHQSFGYEDFIEGFRPNEEGNIELEKGLFLQICKEAEENILKSGEVIVMPFSDAFKTLFKEKIENEESVTIDLKRTGSYFNVNDYNDKTIYFEKQSGTTKHTLSIATLEKMYNEEKNSFINGGLAVYYEPILEKLLEIKRKSIVDKIERKNYYLVIDEINRGNISKIFGELITLIEEDKRDTLEVTLPYSKQTFKIPSNLYIIGTMNSTDKSIALIDIALRRRFTFLKMEPKPSLVTHTRAKEIMIQLNDKITNTLGADYVLGHSYFMKVEENDDLEFVLEYKIKPLLEEYYYGDENGLNEALQICELDTDNGKNE